MRIKWYPTPKESLPWQKISHKETSILWQEKVFFFFRWCQGMFMVCIVTRKISLKQEEPNEKLGHNKYL